MHSGMPFHTVIGDIAYDEKGDRKSVDFVWYVWKKGDDGKITYKQMLITFLPAQSVCRRVAWGEGQGERLGTPRKRGRIPRAFRLFLSPHAGRGVTEPAACGGFFLA